MAEDDVSMYTKRKKQESREGEQKKKEKKREGEADIPLASIEFADAVMQKRRWSGLIGLRSARSGPFDSGRRRSTDWTMWEVISQGKVRVRGVHDTPDLKAQPGSQVAPATRCGFASA
jgi:hypothetical protein